MPAPPSLWRLLEEGTSRPVVAASAGSGATAAWGRVLRQHTAQRLRVEEATARSVLKAASPVQRTRTSAARATEMNISLYAKPCSSGEGGRLHALDTPLATRDMLGTFNGGGGCGGGVKTQGGVRAE